MDLKHIETSNEISSAFTSIKNETNYYRLVPTINEPMKPVHSVNREFNCSEITYGPRTYLLDEPDELSIISSGKRFTMKNISELYPYFKENGVTKNYLDFLFNPQGKRVKYSFLNGNEFDLRRSNVDISSVEDSVLITRKFGNVEHIVPSFSKDETLDCYVISCGPHQFLADREGYQKIVSLGKAFCFDPEINDYPYCKTTNQKTVNYLEIIFSINASMNIIIFKNKNKRDLRRENVDIVPQYFSNVLEGYDILEYLGGHFSNMGVHAGMLKNPRWKIRETDGVESIIMYCEPGVICYLCDKSYDRVVEFEKSFNKGKPISWHQHTNGYVQGHCIGKTLYIHQIILNCFGNGKGTATISVDHIDRNPLNNKLNNLRTADLKTQQNNSRGIAPGTLRERSSKKEFPEGITPDMLHKFVYYNHEVYNKEENKTREFFRVEHPKLQKPWCTTKSGKVSIQEKLAQANRVSDDLDRDIFPQNISKSITVTTARTEDGGDVGVGITKTSMEDVTMPLAEGKEKVVLPKYVSLTIFRNKPHLAFDKRTEEGRLNIKMVLPSKEYSIQEQLEKLNKKIVDKYGDDHTVL
jgi:hypothetical protein